MSSFVLDSTLDNSLTLSFESKSFVFPFTAYQLTAITASSGTFPFVLNRGTSQQLDFTAIPESFNLKANRT